MELALDALRNHNMSLTKASATYGIPSTTLWQRAHRMGIDTPKKEGPTKSWTEENLNNALEALRTGTISANKASKAYGEFHWPYESLLTCCWLYKTVSFVHLSRGHSSNTFTCPRCQPHCPNSCTQMATKKKSRNQVLTSEVLLLSLFFDQSIFSFCCRFENKNLHIHVL